MKHLLKAHGAQTVTGGAIPHAKRWEAVVEVLMHLIVDVWVWVTFDARLFLWAGVWFGVLQGDVTGVFGAGNRYLVTTAVVC